MQRLAPSPFPRNRNLSPKRDLPFPDLSSPPQISISSAREIAISKKKKKQRILDITDLETAARSIRISSGNEFLPPPSFDRPPPNQKPPPFLILDHRRSPTIRLTDLSPIDNSLYESTSIRLHSSPFFQLRRKERKKVTLPLIP